VARKVEHEIRLKDGEVSLLGGVLEQQNMQTLTGIPGLSQIPILKYLFGQKNTDVMDSEIVFAVIPHIVRRKDFNEFNGRTLDVGTANSIHLRHAPATIASGESEEALETVPAAKSIGGWPQMGRWLVPFICRAKAYRQSRCCIRPGRRCLLRSSRHAIRAEGLVPSLK
jgi:Flp pilus assembly secretin CpaC